MPRQAQSGVEGKHLPVHSALAVPAVNALGRKLVAALKHRAAPLLRDDAFALPFAAVKVEHAELDHILAAYVKSRGTHRVPERAGRPCVFAETHHVHERGAKKFEKGRTADLFDDEREKIERSIGVLPLHSLLVGQRLGKHHREIVVCRIKRRVVNVDVEQPARKTGGVLHKHMKRNVLPTRVGSRGQLHAHYIKKFVFRVKQTAVAAYAEGGHGVYFCDRINVVRRIGGD